MSCRHTWNVYHFFSLSVHDHLCGTLKKNQYRYEILIIIRAFTKLNSEIPLKVCNLVLIVIVMCHRTTYHSPS